MNREQLTLEMSKYDIFISLNDVQNIIMSKSFINQLLLNNLTKISYAFYYESDENNYNYREIRIVDKFGMTQEILDMITRNILMSYIGKSNVYYFKYHGNRYVYISNNNNKIYPKVDNFIELKERERI